MYGDEATAASSGCSEPAKTTVAVLNGNGIVGSAVRAALVLARLGYDILTPRGGLYANAPSFNYPRTVVYYDRRQFGSRAAAAGVANAFCPASVQGLQSSIQPLSHGSKITVVVGATFEG
jgi:hypothetical protein